MGKQTQWVIKIHINL